MAAATHKARSRAKEDATPTCLSAMMASLLHPMLDADLADPEIVRLEAKAAKVAKKRAEDDWHVLWLQQEAARHAFEAEECLRIAMCWGRHSEKVEEGERQADLRCRWWHAVDDMMRFPAPSAKALRWKKGRSTMVRYWTPAGRMYGPEPAWARLIADDEARLGKAVQ